MVYIYKKVIGDKTYYYLRASERKGKRIIVKDIAYLGSTIKEVKVNLEKLLPYKDKIRKDGAEYYKKNKEVISIKQSKYGREYYQKNKEIIKPKKREYSREYVQKNKDLLGEYWTERSKKWRIRRGKR